MTDTALAPEGFYGGRLHVNIPGAADDPWAAFPDAPAGLPGGAGGSNVDPWDAFPDAPSVGEDVAKSAGIGLVKGGIGLAGLPGDLAEMGARGIDRASRAVGGLIGVDVKPRQDRPPSYGSS